MSVDREAASGDTHTGHVSLTIKKKTDPHATRWGKFLQAAIKFSASDLILKSEQVPKIRLRGALKGLDTRADELLAAIDAALPSFPAAPAPAPTEAGA